MSNPYLCPLYVPGTEPQLSGFTPEEKEQYLLQLKWQRRGADFMHYCPIKVAMSGVMGKLEVRGPMYELYSFITGMND
jgi:hypothetical protein